MDVRAPSAPSGIQHQAAPGRLGCGAHTGEIAIASADQALATEQELLNLVVALLYDNKAIEPVIIDLHGKTALADQMVVATGTSQRHIGSMADKLLERLKLAGVTGVVAEGLGESSWVLIDVGAVIVHLFRAETRAFYDIERLWSVAPAEAVPIAANG